jgi:hypothetical protein
MKAGSPIKIRLTVVQKIAVLLAESSTTNLQSIAYVERKKQLAAKLAGRR